MTTYHIGGLLIILLGMAIFAASFQVIRTAPRHNAIAAQIGGATISWLVRTFAFLTVMLGTVTMLQR